MAELILLNGPAACGKSTVAERLVASRPLALNLDVDVVRAMHGQWKDQPLEAGLQARRLAVGMASEHLSRGHDVIVAQFLGREDFILELEESALNTNARFVEIALMLTRTAAIDAFTRRSIAALTQQHRDAAEMVDREGGLFVVGEMYDALLALIATRPHTTVIDVAIDDIDTTVHLVEHAIAS